MFRLAWWRRAYISIVYWLRNWIGQVDRLMPPKIATNNRNAWVRNASNVGPLVFQQRPKQSKPTQTEGVRNSGQFKTSRVCLITLVLHKIKQRKTTSVCPIIRSEEEEDRKLWLMWFTPRVLSLMSVWNGLPKEKVSNFLVSDFV
jgi:hypothetical protein